MDSFTWDISSPSSQTESVLTGVAQMSSSQGSIKADWPYAVGSIDFNLYDCQGGPTVQTIVPAAVPGSTALGQHILEEHDNILGIPLHKLQRRWGIGDRKTRDGQPAKRRGPKPDSKPAITRRQEMNRVAQRTHRERKENYMHDLEDAFFGSKTTPSTTRRRKQKIIRPKSISQAEISCT